MKLLSLLIFVSALSLRAAGTISIVVGKSIGEDGCSITRPNRAFQSDDPELFASSVVNVLRTGTTRIEWVDPEGKVVETSEYTDLPAGQHLCLSGHLTLAGSLAATKTGLWKVRVTSQGRMLASTSFALTSSGPYSKRVSIDSVTNENNTSAGTTLTLSGNGFTAGSMVHLAKFIDGGWNYFAAELLSSGDPARTSIAVAKLDPGEYIAVIRLADGGLSAPRRFVVSTGRQYQPPVASGDRWSITQGPNGATSHWNRSAHAWDIAPPRGHYVTAMRSGVAHVFDLGLAQTPGRRIFGNYISIDHGDGEYSHYAHLMSGSFVVREGEHVEQGQRLAIVGNSGYTLGRGGGYHVHVHVTQAASISAPSIPFLFGVDRPESTVVTANTAMGKGRSGEVNVAQWWSEIVSVPPKASRVKISLEWDSPDADLDLHLVSPGGRHFGWYGDRSGYSGQHSRPQSFEVDKPEAGSWRVAVQGIRGSGSPIEFRIQTALEKRKPRS